jgi:hypothetical protein
MGNFINNNITTIMVVFGLVVVIGGGIGYWLNYGHRKNN